jgi:hypothetical protein
MAHVIKAQWKSLIFSVALLFMGWLVYTQWSQIRQLELHPDSFTMSLAVAVLVAIFFADAYGWHLILRAMGYEHQASQNVRIWMLSSLTRYLPGGVWGYVSRAAMCSEQGIPLAASGLGLYLETLMLMGTSLAVGFPALLSATGITLNPATAVTIWMAMGLLVHPKILSMLRRLPGRPGQLFAAEQLPSGGRMLRLYFYYLAFWVIFGATFVGFVLALYPLPTQAWITVGSSFSLSFLIGFVVLFAPSGIGVRESALYVLLLPFLPPAACLLITATSRLWLMLGEALAVAITLACLRKEK